MPELCCWFSKFLCGQSVAPGLHICIFGSQGWQGGDDDGDTLVRLFSLLWAQEIFTMRSNGDLKCKCDCMWWLHARMCHLQNQTSGCSILKMLPHYPLLQNFEKNLCTINMVQKQTHQKHVAHEGIMDVCRWEVRWNCKIIFFSWELVTYFIWWEFFCILCLPKALLHEYWL